MTKTIAQFVQEIIEEIHYYDTILPRIPVTPVHTPVATGDGAALDARKHDAHRDAHMLIAIYLCIHMIACLCIHLLKQVMVQRSMLENIMRIEMEHKALQEKRRRVRVGMKVPAVIMCMHAAVCWAL